MRHKTMLLMAAVLAAGLCLQSCSESRPDSPVSGVTDYSFSKEGPYQLKTTGEVEIVWMGGNGKNTPEMEKRAFADFNAHKNYDSEEITGEFIYRVMSPDLLVVHREIVANVDKYWQTGNESWFSAIVVYDSKGCGTGNGSGGHTDGCDDASGGCSGDDVSHDDGCDHTDTGGDMGGETGCGEDHTDGTDHTDGGCDGGDMGGSPGGDMGGSPGSDMGGEAGGGCGEDHTDGGCSGDHTDTGDSSGDEHTDSGCSGSDTGGSSGEKGNPTSGKNCRIGQIVYVKAYDYATPAIDGDVIGWKWFSLAGNQPKDGHQTEWKLCPKTILGGNLVVHQ